MGQEREPRAEDEAHYRGHRDRLRQRFLAAGPEALADYELIELLLFAAIPRRDVKPLAKGLLAAFGGLGAVLNAPADQLAARAGLGPAAVIALKSVAAAAGRMLAEEVMEKPVLSSWSRLIDYLKLTMQHEPAERFRLLFLNAKNRLIADEVQGHGTVDQAPVYPREVVKRALELAASALILVHNHPSGDPAPSRADIEMTRTLVRALEPVGVTVHDHVIIGRRDTASFKALGLI